MTVLQVSDLHVSVQADNEDRPILRGVDLTIEGGQTHAPMGPNGVRGGPCVRGWGVPGVQAG